MPACLTDFDAIFLDMDGTLYHGDKPLPGVVDLLQTLAAIHLPYACLTNAAWKTPEQIHGRLANMGVHLDPNYLYTAGMAMIDRVMRQWDSPHVCSLAGQAVEQMLDDKVVRVTDRQTHCDAVLLASHMHADKVPLNLALGEVAVHHLRQGAELLVSCKDRVYPIEEGYTFGSGSLAAMFIYAGLVPEERVHYMGKPDAMFMEELCRKLQVDPTRCLMVGDNLESDIQGGLNVGMTTALVLSGVTQQETLKASVIKPHFVFEDINALFKIMG